MTIEALPPALIMILGGLVLPFVSERSRQPLVVFLPMVTLWAVWQIPDGVMAIVPFLDYHLQPVEGDAAGRLFASVFALAGLVGGLFALRQKSVLELSSALVYAGGAIGCSFAGDLITLFVFWEIMALASTGVIWSSDQPNARTAGFRYILVHLFGGVVLMAGITAQVLTTGTVDFYPMELGTPATWLILIGVLVNAGAPPFSGWIADAYPEGSYSGSVFLSAFTTKTAVLVLWKGFPGTELLIWVGMAMVIYGIIYALQENDMRRLLSYSIVNQVGFMVCGIGIGTDLALNGAVAHAFAHILYKAVLLMSAGSVMMMTGGLRKGSDLGGLFRSMPVTAICGIIGALSISAVPLTSGFVSKSLITAAAAESHLLLPWIVLEAASAAAFLYVGLRFPWFTFFDRDSGLRPSEPPLTMRMAMIITAGLCVVLGVFPQPLYALLPYDVDFSPYSGSKLVIQVQLLAFAAVVFFATLALTRPKNTISLDFDWFYRSFLGQVAREFRIKGGAVRTDLLGIAQGGIRGLINFVLHTHGPAGAMGRPWSISASVLSVAALLCLYLLLYYL